MESKPPSGGKRAVDKKHAERDAARRRLDAGVDPARDWLEQVDRLGAPPKDPDRAHTWLAHAAVLVVQATLRDVGLPPEQMRRDAMRQIEQASKVLDPAKLSAQLDELETALQELRKNARYVETGENRPASASTDLL